MRHLIVFVGLLNCVLCKAQLATSKKINLRSDQTFSGVRIDSILSRQQKENLVVLAKTWGFLKYYHPDVAAGSYNFDSCLFSILTPVLNAENKLKRDEALFNWINTLGDETKHVEIRDINDSTIYSKPQLDWLSGKKIFSQKLSMKLKNIYRHRSADTNYYVRPAEELNPRFVNEAVYQLMDPHDDGFRMLALFRYWNIIEYFFPYKHLFTKDWSEVLKEFLPEFAANKSPLEYRLTCWRLINSVHDTHASIYRDSILNNWTGMRGPAIEFKTINKKIIVYDYLDDSLARFETLKPGDEILTVDDRPVAEIRKSYEPYLCASNGAAADRNFLWRFLFFRRDDDSLFITYKREGKVNKGTMRLYYQPPFQNGDTWRKPMYELLSDDIGYINIGKIKADSLPVIFKKFRYTKGIIIDIRNYPNEFMPYAMGKYLKPVHTPFTRYTGPDYKNPGGFKLIGYISNGATETDSIETYKGLIIILVNEQTQSSAEYTAMALRTAPRATVMGSQTAGADGDISRVPFPGGFYSAFSGLGIYYPDGKETQGVGIVPDINVYPTQKGIATGKDEVLEKAKEYISKAKAF